MSIQGTSNNQAKSISDFQNEKFSESVKTDKNAESVNKKLSIFINSAYEALNNILEDGQVSNTPDNDELGTMQKWVKMMEQINSNISAKIKQKCAEVLGGLEYLKETFESFINDATQDSLEPDTTDADNFNHDLLIAPERLFSLEDPHMKQDYYDCLNANISNRLKASKLQIFQAKYKENLKNIASSVKTDGTYELNNLYDQITSQIKYYTDLADKEIEGLVKPRQNHGLSDKERAKLAHQKIHTREDFINDLIRNGCTKEKATKIADENGII